MSDLPQFERPDGIQRGTWIAKTIIQGLVLGIAFAVSYWSFTWFAQLGNSRAAQEKQAKQQAEYEASVKKADELVDRSAAMLSKQEEHVKRLDAVISAWERQAGLKK